jgi:hypothetical protein
MAGELHFHVIAENYEGDLVCSDGCTWPGAEALVADLISPPNGETVYEPVQTVWIVEGEAQRCPFAHGDGVPVDENAVAEFLERLVQRQPYWSA